ncbi:alpha/beta fold hydrolase [Idiomarina seosinensis]|uniref:AB hydrolase-1 domain-containing protein n=1 Tax=Idiomarina seosinensis TaxID=281739 RepID=A0A432ZGI3_9GAMM|nr:alpha/beta hydrolase [Idiomarina seosinensis]RUO77014.1 hypothetical protein CWI81_00470 [Idiomarina seosinensis]
MDKSTVLLRNNVTIKGSGEVTLLLAHGFGCDQTIWDRLTPDFYSSCTVVTFDYVGSGESDLNHYTEERYQDLNGYADDLVDVITALDLHNIVLVAHSVSGSIATLAFPEIKSRLLHIVMLNPSPRYIHDEPSYKSGFSRSDVDQLMVMMEQNFYGWAQGMAPQVMDNPEHPELSSELEQHFRAGESRIVRAFARATFYSDVRSKLEKVACPVTILQADKDIVVPQMVAEYVTQQLPDARLKIINARGHYPHVSAPDVVSQEITKVVKEQYREQQVRG